MSSPSESVAPTVHYLGFIGVGNSFRRDPVISEEVRIAFVTLLAAMLSPADI